MGTAGDVRWPAILVSVFATRWLRGGGGVGDWRCLRSGFNSRHPLAVVQYWMRLMRGARDVLVINPWLLLLGAAVMAVYTDLIGPRICCFRW